MKQKVISQYEAFFSPQAVQCAKWAVELEVTNRTKAIAILKVANSIEYKYRKSGRVRYHRSGGCTDVPYGLWQMKIDHSNKILDKTVESLHKTIQNSDISGYLRGRYDYTNELNSRRSKLDIQG